MTRNPERKVDEARKRVMRDESERVPVDLYTAASTPLLKIATMKLDEMGFVTNLRNAFMQLGFSHGVHLLARTSRDLERSNLAWSWVDDTCEQLGVLWGDEEVPPQFEYESARVVCIRTGYKWDEDLVQAMEDIIGSRRTLEEVTTEALAGEPVDPSVKEIESEEWAMVPPVFLTEPAETTMPPGTLTSDEFNRAFDDVEPTDDIDEEGVAPFIFDSKTGEQLRMPDLDELNRALEFAAERISEVCGDDLPVIEQLRMEREKVRHLRSVVMRLPEFLYAYGDFLHLLALPEEEVFEDERGDGEDIEVE